MLKYLCLITVSLYSLSAQSKKELKAWPGGVKEIEYTSSIDNTKQPSLIYTAKSKEKRPLLVGLHSWSTNYLSGGGDLQYAQWAIEQDWHFVHPHFRGENWTPKAMGSDFVVADIVSIVEYMKKNFNVDEERIYLIGCSGGGYATLLMAGRKPEIWAGVSAWVPISDIYAWWEQRDQGSKKNSRYARNIEAVIGGRPDENEALKEICMKRSALTYMEKAKGLNIDINHGINDGRSGSVPFTHSLFAFNKLALPQDRFKLSEIEEFYKTRELPAGMKKAEADPLFGDKTTLFRRISGNARVTIFDGGHEIVHKPALNWLANQRKGQNAVWDLKNIREIKVSENDSKVSR